MPGIHSTHQPGSVFAPDWQVYRSGIAADDDTGNPGLVTDVIDLSGLPAGNGCQIWITAERTVGAGFCQLSAFTEGFGSLAALKPFNSVPIMFMLVDHLNEVRFTSLPAVPCRVLLTGITPGDEWTLHYTILSLPVI